MLDHFLRRASFLLSAFPYRPPWSRAARMMEGGAGGTGGDGTGGILQLAPGTDLATVALADAEGPEP